MRRLLGAVFLVSAAVLGFELSLMRMLLVASFHHFAFLVISVALLGFGASGTALLVFRSRAMRGADGALFALCIAAAASMPLCAAIIRHVPLEARIVPALLAKQAGSWVLVWAVLTIPFFLGAAAAGLGLMLAPKRAGAVYGANLLGSAAGALAAPAAMTIVPPAWLPVACGGAALGAAAVLAGARPVRWVAAAAAVIAVAGWLALDPPRIAVDPFKDAARMSRLAAQGSVARVGRAIGPRAVVEAYRGPVLHDLPFLSVGRAPPPLGVLLCDGNLAGSVLEVSDPQDAAAVDGKLSALPYDLIASGPRVALLGEGGTANVWLAIRRGAASIEVVQPDANVVRLLRGVLHDSGGAVLDDPRVRVRVAEPRHFVASSAGPFDLIQVSALEAQPAGSGGVGGLAQDHLVTVEGIAACLRRLGPDGVVAITRGIQLPPRDNLKILAPILAALRRLGAASPEAHIVVVRDYLAVCTIARSSPWPPESTDAVRAACRARQLTPVWWSGVTPQELNQPDALPQPPDGIGDWYHHAMRELAGPQRDRFIAEWPFDIRPPTDDRPFFGDFCRLRSLSVLRAAYGDLWLTRADLGFVFVLAAAAAVAIAGIGATILPLGVLAREGAAARRGPIAAYFGAIGLAYLLLEMLILSRLSLIAGDPVRAAAVTIGGFLLFSGIGSFCSERVRRPGRTMPVIAGAIVLLGAAETVLLAAIGPAAGGLPPVARYVACLLVVAPLAWLMGFPMPLALARIGCGDNGARIAWAWGTNGFASVLAAPLAQAVAMAWGWTAAAAAGLLLYAAAGVVFSRLPGVGDVAASAPQGPGLALSS